MKGSRKRKARDLVFTVVLMLVGILFWKFWDDMLTGIVLIAGGFLLSYKEVIGLSNMLEKILFDRFKTIEQNMDNTNHSVQIGGNIGQNAKITIISNTSPEDFKKILATEYGKMNVVKSKDIYSKDIKKMEENNIDYRESKELLDKIYSYLDESKPLDIVAEMALRLCSNLKMNHYMELLKSEVYGYDVDSSYKPLEFVKKSKDNPEYRVISAKQVVCFNGSADVSTFNIPFFIPLSLSVIVNGVKLAGRSEELSFNMFPLKIMVDHFKVNPNDKVPYIIQANSLRNLLSGFRVELNKFLLDAKNEIDKWDYKK